MSPALRRFVLTVHIAISVGWVGAIAAYTALDVAAAGNSDGQTLRAAYLGMDLIAGNVIVPLALASLVTGVVISLGTKWGLFRHYWVVISLLLTVVAAAVLLVETETIRSFAAVANDQSASPAELRALGTTLPHSIGGMIVLLIVLVLNMYKPKGLTPYGWRKEQQRSTAGGS